MGITRDEALDCLRSDDLLGIGMEADAVRRRLHPEGIVTYGIGAPLDLGSVQGGAKKIESLVDQLLLCIEAGATGIRIRGLSQSAGAHAVRESLDTVRTLRNNFPSVWLEVASLEIQAISNLSRLQPATLVSELQDAGIDAIGVDEDSAATTSKSSNNSLQMHRAAHQAGMPTVATLTFGVETSIEQRVEQLVRLHELQTETGGFMALAVVATLAAGGRELDGVTAVERLKMLATARMFLDSILHVTAMPSAHGLKVLQTSLRFGANDLGWVPPVAGKSDSPHEAPEEDMRRIIRDAGFTPAERDARYRAMIAV